MKRTPHPIVAKLEFNEFHASIMSTLMEQLCYESTDFEELIYDIAATHDCKAEEVASVFEDAMHTLNVQKVI